MQIHILDLSAGLPHASDREKIEQNNMMIMLPLMPHCSYAKE
jgi:hypothetical protein